ncbi:MAG TPA: response regulator [Xanthobacteraceae bacterium]|nr:response regulator [Xanthobacteraceae bacterium]
MARILVVDDDVLIRLTLKTVLESAGHTVVLAECGHHGAEAIEAYAFDLAIVDIFMPGMNGLETIKVFRESAPTLPVIAISGYVFRDASEPAPDFLRMAVDLGAAACLRKPFTGKQLLDAIADCKIAPVSKVA